MGSLNKRGFDFGLVIGIIILKRTNIEWSCINQQWCLPSLCCLHPAALKVWTESEGRTELPGLWVPGPLPRPRAPNTWVSLHPVLCLCMKPGSCEELCAGKALVPPQNHSSKRMFLLNVHQTWSFPCCWAKDEHPDVSCWRKACITVDPQSPNVQTVVLRGKAITLIQDRRHNKQVEIFA